MAKDPAFLFYSNDFDQKTKFFTDEQVGKYIRLMIAQHQHGHLTEPQMLFICKTQDKQVLDKFIQDTDGLFYNERLEFEINKRKSFTESRRNNRTKKDTSITSEKDMSEHMLSHMENENENDIYFNNKIGVQNNFQIPTIEQVIEFTLSKGYSEDVAKKAFEYYSNQDWKDKNNKPINNWRNSLTFYWFTDENKKPKEEKIFRYKILTSQIPDQVHKCNEKTLKSLKQSYGDNLILV